MAILEAVPGIKVTVCVDKQALQEYDDDELEAVPEGEVEKYQASRTVAKYIESRTGKNFRIKLEISKAYRFDSPTVGFFVFVDGVRVRKTYGGERHIPL
ncbi:hypothetical protein OCU04_005282 [Sclerotinia nivalis]|uniref:DUF7918 domain-containing protein n=1 Tax=Sclerotinia nivalis TaxID=352851 RepID=A0A9X0DJT5_9HELO|nr:hypothetical protein OCU04_005282 [Sclerotinia nivalis]